MDRTEVGRTSSNRGQTTREGKSLDAGSDRSGSRETLSADLDR